MHLDALQRDTLIVGFRDRHLEMGVRHQLEALACGRAVRRCALDRGKIHFHGAGMDVEEKLGLVAVE